MTPKRIKKRAVTRAQNSAQQNKNGYIPPRNSDGSISIKANVELLKGKDKQEFINLYSKNKK